MPNTTQRLADELNRARGLTYPAPGYVYWADVKGDGTYSPRLWAICNPQGGVVLSDLHHDDARKRCALIRAAIETANRNRHGVTLAPDAGRPWFPKESHNV